MAKIKNDKVSAELDLKTQTANERIHELTNATKQLRAQNNAYRKEISLLAATEGDHSKEIRRLNEALMANEREIEKNKRAIAEEEKGIDLTRKTAAQLGKQLKDLKRQLNNTSRAADPKEYKKLEGEIREVERAYAEATKSTRGFLTSLLSLDKVSTTVKGFFMGLGMVIMTQVVTSFKKLTGVIMDFEQSNAKLAAVLGTSFDGIKRLTDQAKFLGRTTTATASEVTGLQTELAKLGFSQEVIENMTPAVLKFAKAVDTDLSSASAFAGAALRIFNKDASEAEEVMATFAIATSKSALDFNKLEASLSTIGPIASSFGLTVEETTALLGTLANAGFDASSAATATRNILLNLCDANGELARSLGGPVSSLDEIVAGLNKLNAEGVDLNKVLELTDKRSAAAFSQFLGKADEMLELRDSISGVTEEFDQMTVTMSDTATGSWKGFGSAVEGLILKFFDFRFVLKGLFEAATSLIQWVGDLIDGFQPLWDVLGMVVKGVGAVVVGVAKLTKAIADFVVKFKPVMGIVSGAVAAWAAYKIAILTAIGVTKLKNISLMAHVKHLMAATAGVKNLTTAWNTFSKVMKSAVVISAIVGFATMIWGWIKPSDEAAKAIDKVKESTERLKDAISDSAFKVEEERNKLQSLREVAMSEVETKEARLAAIDKLNKIIPGYNASIDAETGAYRESKRALDDYLASLERKYRLEAFKDEYQKLIKEDAERRKEIWKGRKEWYELQKNQYALYEQHGDPRNSSPFDFDGAIWNGEKIIPNKNQNNPFYGALVSAEKDLNMDFDKYYESLGTEEAKALIAFYDETLVSTKKS